MKPQLHDGVHAQVAADTARLWWLEAFYGLELLTAHYSRHIFPRHLHTTFVVQVVEQGTDEFLCQGVTRAAPAGSVVIINPQDVHTGRSVDALPLRYRSLYPSVELLCDITAQLDDRALAVPYFPEPVIRDPQLAQLLFRAHRALERRESQLEAACLLTQALGMLILGYAEPQPHQQPSGYEQAALRRVQMYLADHLADNISLEQLTQIAGFSPFHLIRVFRAATGLAPYEYLTNLRIARAKQLLAEQRSIVQVATSLGFYDQSHLHRHFKRIVGVTPGAYRKGISPRPIMRQPDHRLILPAATAQDHPRSASVHSGTLPCAIEVYERSRILARWP